MNSSRQTRRELLEALSELSRLLPEWRLGQIIANLAMTAGRMEAGAVWDLEDDEALAAAKTLIQQEAELEPGMPSTAKNMLETNACDNNEMNFVWHPNPCMASSPECTEMVVDLTPFDMPGRFERLVVTPSPSGNHVVVCLPFFTYGINFGDWVEMREPGNEFVRVLEKSGLKTIRVAFHEDSIAETMHEELHGKLNGTSLPHEWHRPTYLAVLIRDEDDQRLALSIFQSAIEDDLICWELDPDVMATS
jgi:hypothetical protein